MSDYNFSKYIRHTSSFEAPDGNKMLTAAGWVEASKKIIVAMTEVCSQASKLVDEMKYETGPDLPNLGGLEIALERLAELDGGK